VKAGTLPNIIRLVDPVPAKKVAEYIKALIVAELRVDVGIARGERCGCKPLFLEHGSDCTFSGREPDQVAP
jgi:hypothetical protein